MQIEFQEYTKQYFPLNNIQVEHNNNNIKVNKKGLLVKIIQFTTKGHWNIWKQNFLLEIEHQQQLSQQFPNHVLQIMDWSLEIRSNQIFIYVTYNCTQKAQSLYYYLSCALIQSEQKRDFAQQILEIAYILETSNIQHRNIKLSNFIIGDNNKIQLTDFGSARTHYQTYTKQSNTSVERLKQCQTIFYNCPEILEIVSEENNDFQEQNWKKVFQNQQNQKDLLTRNDNWGISIVLLQLVNYKIEINDDIKSFYGYNIAQFDIEIKQIILNPEFKSIGETIKCLSLGKVSASECLQLFLNSNNQKPIKVKEKKKQLHQDGIEQILLSKNINIKTAIDFLYLSKEQIEDLEQCYDVEKEKQIVKRIQPDKQEYNKIKQQNLDQIPDHKSQFSDQQSFLVFSPKGAESQLLSEAQLQVLVNENCLKSGLQQDNNSRTILRRVQVNEKVTSSNKDKSLAFQLQKQNLQIINDKNVKLNQFEESTQESAQKQRMVKQNNESNIYTITQLTRLNSKKQNSFQNSNTKINSQYDLLNYSSNQAHFLNEVSQELNQNQFPVQIQKSKVHQEQLVYPLEQTENDADQLVNFEKFADIAFHSRSIREVFNIPFDRQQIEEQQGLQIFKQLEKSSQLQNLGNNDNFKQQPQVEQIQIEKKYDSQKIEITSQQRNPGQTELVDLKQQIVNDQKLQVLEYQQLQKQELLQNQLLNNQQSQIGNEKQGVTSECNHQISQKDFKPVNETQVEYEFIPQEPEKRNQKQFCETSNIQQVQDTRKSLQKQEHYNLDEFQNQKTKNKFLPQLPQIKKDQIRQEHVENFQLQQQFQNQLIKKDSLKEFHQITREKNSDLSIGRLEKLNQSELKQNCECSQTKVEEISLSQISEKNEKVQQYEKTIEKDIKFSVLNNQELTDDNQKIESRKEKIIENMISVELKFNKILKKKNGTEILSTDELKFLNNDQQSQYSDYLQQLNYLNQNQQQEITKQQEQIEQNIKLQNKLTTNINQHLLKNQLNILNVPFLENYLEQLKEKLNQLDESQSQIELKKRIQEQIQIVNQFYDQQFDIIEQNKKDNLILPQQNEVQVDNKGENMILTKQLINFSNNGLFSRLNSNEVNNDGPQKQQSFGQEQAPLLPTLEQTKKDQKPSLNTVNLEKRKNSIPKIIKTQINGQSILNDFDDFEIWSTNPIIRRFQVWKKTQPSFYEIPQELEKLAQENRKKIEDKNKLYGGYSQDGKPHGLGILMKKPFGSIYEGVFNQGKFIYGLVLELNEKNLLQRYVGYYHIEKQVKHGIAQLVWFREKLKMFEIEEEYKGPTIFGQLTGLATRINYTQGWKYEGQWQKSKKSGKGSIFMLNEKKEYVLKYEGSFQEDFPHGKGKCFHDTNLYEEGEYVKGQKRGPHYLYLHGVLQKSIFY